jgi:adenylate cyclase
LVGLLVALAAHSGVLVGVERWAYNLEFKLRGPIPPKTPVVIISIDEDSFDELDLQWPWPRALHGRLVDVVSRGKPAAIGLDLIFDVPSSRGHEDDLALALAIERADTVVLGAAITEVQTKAYSKADLNPPIDELFDRAAAVGFVNYRQDEDAYIRSAVLTRIFQDKPTSGFDFYLHELGVRAGIPSAPLPDEPTFLINYRGGPQTFATIPYYQVVTGEVGPEAFTGKIVLVGATSSLLHDVFPTPFSTHGEMPGVEIHANVLETLFQGIPLERTPRGWSVLFTLGAGLLAVWLTNRLRPLVAFGLILAVALCYAAGSFMSFATARLVFEMTAVPLALVIGYGATVVENFIQEQRKRALLMNLFSRHVAPEVAEAIWQERDQFMDGGRLRSQKMVATVLFTDLKGFTPVAERLDTQALLDWLNGYMEIMAQLVMDHGGVVDDYAGDAIKADFGVPFARTTEADINKDAVNAVECALSMERELNRLNKLWQEQGLPTIGTRIGICTGPVVAGSLGSKQRLKYTTIGDTVNTGARLESFDKDLVDPYFTKSPCRVLISETTYNCLGDQFITKRIGEVSVKGKEQKVSVYRVLGRKGTVEPYASLRSVPRIREDTTARLFDGEITVEVPVYDLSTGGLCGYSLTFELDRDQVVQLSVALSSNAPPIAVNAKVAWIAEDKAGFAFLDLKPEDRAAIEELLAGRLAAAQEQGLVR